MSKNEFNFSNKINPVVQLQESCLLIKCSLAKCHYLDGSSPKMLGEWFNGKHTKCLVCVAHGQ